MPNKKPGKPAKTTKHAGRIAASSLTRHRTPGGAFKSPPSGQPDPTQTLAKAGTLPGDVDNGVTNPQRANRGQLPGEWPDEPGE
jgi:hypothetical protein